MSELIPDMEAMSLYIPNYMADAEGERSLYSKIEHFLETSQEWLVARFIGEEIDLDSLPAKVRKPCARAVACDAWRRAVPALDLVLTANGFAVAGNQNLTPASRQRVDALLASLEEDRDSALAELLKLLPTLPGWTESKQGKWFAATLFQNLDVVAECGIKEHVWAEYKRLRPRIADIEESLAEEWMSSELMAALREDIALRSLCEARAKLVKALMGQIVTVLNGGAFSSRRLTEAVNFIRRNPKEFSEWHGSHIAELFQPPLFRNDKKSAGYFF